MRDKHVKGETLRRVSAGHSRTTKSLKGTDKKQHHRMPMGNPVCEPGEVRNKKSC